MAACLHCGVETGREGGFCCAGCEAAYQMVAGLGLEAYYRRRCLDPEAPPLRPDGALAPLDYASHVQVMADGSRVLHLMVEGLQCAACVWLIESVLARQTGVTAARVNMTTRRLVLRWRGDVDPDQLAGAVNRLGYRLVPFDPAHLDAEGRRIERELLRATAVAGFAAANVMLLSVSVWAGHFQDMEPATRGLFHWLSALIALPAVAFAGLPFYRSALRAAAGGHLNMDVPISLAVILSAGMSLYETITGGLHAYFDSSVTLLFFLLIGRYLDRRARMRARTAAEHLLTLGAAAVTIVDSDGRHHLLPPSRVAAGMVAFAAAGDRIGVDGRVREGSSEVDCSLVSGESLPVPVEPGARVFAGTLNLAQPLTIEVTAVGEGTLLAEIVRLMEAAERGRAKYVAIADRVARWYAPVVHVMALVTFAGWLLIAQAPWQPALLNAIAVLIVTCPCALGLAVPVVHVIASGRLLGQGILVKSGTALERLAEVDTIAFDKTGTLTLGRPELLAPETAGREALAAAAALAAASRHPLARALVRAAGPVVAAEGVAETPGAGLLASTKEGEVRLGNRTWCGIAGDPTGASPELWLARPGHPPVRFAFADRLREDAADVVSELTGRGFAVCLLSGDREAVTAEVARQTGIQDWQAGMSPAAKHARLAEMAARGRRVLMVGDGLNDAPALASAHASLSPSTAVDLNQTTADVIFQGSRLAPVLEIVEVARRADRLVKENFALSFLYNGLAVPLAVAGLLTPLIAAIAMSASSIVVIANALRLARRRSWTFS